MKYIAVIGIAMACMISFKGGVADAKLPVKMPPPPECEPFEGHPCPDPNDPECHLNPFHPCIVPDPPPPPPPICVDNEFHHCPPPPSECHLPNGDPCPTPVPLAANDVRGFHVRSDGWAVWHTNTEIGVLGFWLYRLGCKPPIRVDAFGDALGHTYAWNTRLFKMTCPKDGRAHRWHLSVVRQGH